MTQLALLSPNIGRSVDATSSTFSNNMSLPIHRWFRYSAGFSGIWVRETIESRRIKNSNLHVYDPFAGSGTVLIESQLCGVDGLGLEPHPFVHKIAEAKLLWRRDAESLFKLGLALVSKARGVKGSLSGYPVLIRKCFTDDVLLELDCLKIVWDKMASKKISDDLKVLWLLLTSILRECSHAGTAQWQYVLPNKQKAKVGKPFIVFQKKLEMFCDDIMAAKSYDNGGKAIVIKGDARNCSGIPSNWANLVITSPPYANNYDYADATRLELCFWKEISGWSDLQETIRKHLLRSCTQHVSGISNDIDLLLSDPLLEPIRSEIRSVCQQLALERVNHGGKKQYHVMIAAYFKDLAACWKELRRITTKNAEVCFVIGDSAPYGIYVPVDIWLGKLALSVGFRSFNFEQTRVRNLKWKNRKHRVPLKEGRLWVKG